MTRRALRLLGLVIVVACADNSRDSAITPDTLAASAKLSQSTNASDPVWQVRPLHVAPERFRPGGWSDEVVLWGLVRGRVTKLDTKTGVVSTPSQTAWWVHAARGLATWGNESGTWMLRDGGKAIRLAGPETDPQTGFDGPPTVLWSPDGSRALLGWQGEWNAHYDLLERDGSTRRLEIATPGYFGNAAVLWLDSARVLFQTVAKGSVVGDPAYREIGWRGDLAVLDLRTNAYTRVTSVPDSIYLRIAGLHLNDVLITEWDREGVRAHWFYDPRSWQRRPASLPKGRAYPSPAGAVVMVFRAVADSANAVLVTASNTLELGHVSQDAQPAFSPSGRRGALRTNQGVIIFEAR